MPHVSLYSCVILLLWMRCLVVNVGCICHYVCLYLTIVVVDWRVTQIQDFPRGQLTIIFLYLPWYNQTRITVNTEIQHIWNLASNLWSNSGSVAVELSVGFNVVWVDGQGFRVEVISFFIAALFKRLIPFIFLCLQSFSIL